MNNTHTLAEELLHRAIERNAKPTQLLDLMLVVRAVAPSFMFPPCIVEHCIRKFPDMTGALHRLAGLLNGTIDLPGFLAPPTKEELDLADLANNLASEFEGVGTIDQLFDGCEPMTAARLN